MSSTTWRGRELLGSQLPRVWSAPSADTSAGSEAVRLAEVARVEPFPWQRWFCDKALGQRVDADGSWRWAQLEVLLLVSRQNGKGTCIEIIELYALFSLGLNVYHTSHQMKTSRKAFKRLWMLIDRTPQLRRRVLGKPRQTAEEIVIVLVGGAQITFMARSGRAGRGLDDCDVLILDEAMYLDPKMVEATLPTMTTRATPLVIYASTAGVKESVLLRALRKRLIDLDPTLAGFDWSVDEDDVRREEFDPLAVEVVAQANPSLGVLVTMDYVAGEFAALTSTGSLQGYLRERLGVFDADPAAAKRVIPAAAWAGRAGAEDPPDGPVAFGVAAAWPDASHTAIAVVGWRADLLVVQVVEHRPGTAWRLPRLRELVNKYEAPVVIDPGGPAGDLIRDIEGEEIEPGDVPIEVLKPTMRDVGHASKDLLDEIAGETPRLWHYDQAELNAAVAGAGRRTLGDLWTWQRRGDADISPLEAVTLGAWGCQFVNVIVPAPVAVASSSSARIETADLSRIGF